MPQCKNCAPWALSVQAFDNRRAPFACKKQSRAGELQQKRALEHAAKKVSWTSMRFKGPNTFRSWACIWKYGSNASIDWRSSNAFSLASLGRICSLSSPIHTKLAKVCSAYVCLCMYLSLYICVCMYVHVYVYVHPYVYAYIVRYIGSLSCVTEIISDAEMPWQNTAHRSS